MLLLYSFWFKVKITRLNTQKNEKTQLVQSGKGYLKIFLQSCKINKDFFTKFHEEHSIAAFWLHTKLQKTVSHFVDGLWSASRPIEKKNGQEHWVIDSLSDFEARETEHGDIGFHTAVRWLSLRKVLKRVWEQKLKHFVRRKAIVFQISHMTNARQLFRGFFFIDVH